MSIASRNKEKKLKGSLYESYIKTFKLKIDEGISIDDLSFDIFGDDKDYYYSFIKEYINLKERKGIDIFDKKEK